MLSYVTIFCFYFFNPTLLSILTLVKLILHTTVHTTNRNIYRIIDSLYRFKLYGYYNIVNRHGYTFGLEPGQNKTR